MDLMEKLDKIIEQGIIEADKVRNTLTIREFQVTLMDYVKANDLNNLIGEILKANPGKRRELQLKILAFTAEGKLVKDSLLAH